MPRTSPPAQQADWWVPGAYPIADDIHRIPMPMPSIGLRAINTYALSDGDGGLVMIDSGWSPLPESRDRLLSALAEIGHSLEDVRGFLITHLHRDHYTYAVEHRREFGSWIGLGEGERASLEAFGGFTGRPHDVELRRLRHDGAAELARTIQIDPVDASIWESPDRWIASGTRFEIGRSLLTAVATPGHTLGHLVYLDVDRSLAYTGDHVLPRITPTIGSEASMTPHPLADFLLSLERMGDYGDALVLPAHGPVGAALGERSQELLEHHQARLRDCVDALDATPATAAEVAARLPWTRKRLPVDELTPDNRMRAIFETALHLDLLARRSVIQSVDLAGVAYFNKTGPEQLRGSHKGRAAPDAAHGVVPKLGKGAL